jgi:hypothetical protein
MRSNLLEQKGHIVDNLVDWLYLLALHRLLLHAFVLALLGHLLDLHLLDRHPLPPAL